MLRHAFTLRLPRHISWRCPPQNAFVHAARYYKRGVPLQHDQQARVAPPPTQLLGITQLTELRSHLAHTGLIICDRGVADHYPIVKQTTTLTIAATEQDKCLTTVATILQQWRVRGKPSTWTIIGGGITIDIAAFAASLCNATIVLLPTTLLAMIDAAHGGKNGVNFPPWGKNQLGTFYAAAQVIICPVWLQSLPPADLRAASWEGVKHALISGNSTLLQTWLQQQIQRSSVWELELLLTTAQIKIDIVQRDFYESGERRVLNFGHTLAHALEAVAQDNGSPLRHGDAVGIGIVFALLLSHALRQLTNFKPFAALSHSPALLSSAELATALGYSDLSTPQLWEKLLYYIAQDKKQDNQAVWILLQDATPLPRVSITPQAVPTATLQTVWQQLLQTLERITEHKTTFR